MTSLYKQSIPPMTKYLKNLCSILTAAVKYADEKDISHEKILSYRLIDDMRPLPYQIQSCSNTAKFFLTRIKAIDDIVLEDNETTFDQLQARVTKTIEILRSVDESNMEGREVEEVLMETKMGNFKFENGQRYLSEYVLPNFHFHLTTAYCLLRQQGIPIGAFDYLGKDTFVKA